MIEFHELIDIVPHDLIRRMENMSTVLVDVNAFLLLTVHIAADIVAPFQNKAGLPGIRHFTGKNRSKQPAANNQIIIHKANLL